MLFNVVIELDEPSTHTSDDDDWVKWMDDLDAYAGTVGGSMWGTRTVHFCIDGKSVSQAAFTACALAKTVTGYDPYALEIMPQGEFERRNDCPVSV